MSLKKKFSFTVLTVLLFLTLIETSLRITAYLKKKTLFSALTVDDSILDWRLMSNYSDEKEGIYINSLGFRGKELKEEKENSVFRIIALGDSCTFGVGSEGATYPEILEKILNKVNSIKYQVINAGVPGYSSSQLLLYLKHELIDYKPDLILVYIGWNDIWTYKNPAANTSYSPRIRKISRLLSKSLSFVFLRNYVINPVRGKLNFKNSQKNDLTFEDKFKEKLVLFERNIFEMIRLAKTNNYEIAIFTLPTVIRKEMTESDMMKFSLAITWTDGYDTFLKMYTQLNEVIRNVGVDKKVEVIDLDFIFNQLPIENVKSLFSDAVHPNKNGLSIIAEHIAKKIEYIHERTAQNMYRVYELL